MPETEPHERLIRLGVVTYVFALLLIAAFSIAFHFISDSIVSRQEDTARVVNISGRQRMLSQRIARLTLERAAHARFRPDAEAQGALLDSIHLMQESEEALLHGSAEARISAPTSAVVRSVYTDQPWVLNQRVEDYILHASRLAARPSASLSLDDPDLLAVQQAAQAPLLNALDAVVIANQSTSENAIHRLRHVLAVLTLLMLVILMLEALLLYRPLFRRLARAQSELVLAGRTDPLTGCLNRRAFSELAQKAVVQAQQSAGLLSVIMVDIDRFKSINDTYGHATGDLVINAVVRMLVNGIRGGDTLCRMGGEEFAVLLPNETLASATHAAERLRQAIADHPVPLDRNESAQPLSVTVSMGTGLLRAGEDSIFQVLGRADKALYRAKVNGRNRTESEATEPEQEQQPDYKHRSRV